MLTSRKATLRPLIESNQGVHLTAYLVHGEIVDLKAQLRRVIAQASKWLDHVMKSEEKAKFFEPLDSLLLDPQVFKHIKGNIGIFRNRDSFRVLNIPVNVEPTCHVATSFHVKPLLRWLQNDQEFLLLGLTNTKAHLYLGSQNSFRLLDSIVLPHVSKNNTLYGYLSLAKPRKRLAKEEKASHLLNNWIFEWTMHSKPKLFLAGEKRLTDSVNLTLNYKNFVKEPVANLFSKNDAVHICNLIRQILNDESKDMFNKSMFEFQPAEEENQTRKDIFEISRAAAQGRIRKLMVTDDINIFGKIDKRSGRLLIHPFDLDHEDDDILDDLAQMVLKQGGEVIVAARDQIPKGYPALAILHDHINYLEKSESSQWPFTQLGRLA